MRLTRPNVSRLVLPLGKSEQLIFDDALPGFGIRIRAGGKRTWIAQYRTGKQQRRVTIGSVDIIDPDEARSQARKILAKVQLGSDPQTEKAENRSRAVLNLGKVAETYLERYAAPRMKPKTLADTTRYLVVSWRSLHSTPLEKIDRRLVAARLAEIALQSGEITSNRARAALSSLFSWAMREGLVDANPVIGTNRAVDERSRDRILSDEELTAIWRACRDNDFGRIVRLLILTGQRREEVGGMAGQEIDLPRARWTIPRERSKNGLPHEVPLPASALEIIRGGSLVIGRDLLFGEGVGPFQGWSKAKAALDRRIAQSGAMVAPWRLHDIRRTVATRMTDLGVLPHVVESVLNHISGHKAGVAGIYNRATYREEKRQALERWSEHVRSVSEGVPTTVMPLKAHDPAE